MKMRAVLGLLAVGLCAQATFGKIQVSFGGLAPISHEDGRHVGVVNGLQEATTANNMHPTDGLLSGDREPQGSWAIEHAGHRKLADVEVTVLITGADADTTLTVKVTVYAPLPNSYKFRTTTVEVTTDSNGEATTSLSADESYFNDDLTSVCDLCSLAVVQEQCPDSECDLDMVGYIIGDPHMVGLLGQKIDWAGVDNAWYCLLSDGSDFHVNVRLSAPMPEEFPDRQLISAVSFLTADGLHSLVVEVKNPYSTSTDGCPEDSSVPCLADGGLRILVDGEERPAMQAPTENVRLPGGYPVVVSSANLPAECRPFGGDRIWATQFADMMSGQRSLRTNFVPFKEWILQPDTLAAPTWCAKYLEDEGTFGLLATRSEHATLRVETPVATLRINVGVNYQDLETAADGTVLVPELEFWQTDLGFDGLRLSGDVAGLMGDTSRFVLDDEGMPVTSGLGALHGPVENYRVAGPIARDFEQLHQ